MQSIQPAAVSGLEHSGHSRVMTWSAFQRLVGPDFAKSGEFFVVTGRKAAINCLMPRRNSRFPWVCGGELPSVRRLKALCLPQRSGAFL